MTDIELVIKIPEDVRIAISRMGLLRIPDEMQKKVDKAIQRGKPIPDNATNERMVGSWIKSRDSYGNHHFTCSECGNDIATQYADNWEDNYCSNCGAKMESEDKE